MRKLTKTYIDKSRKELAAEAIKIREDIARAQLSRRASPPKDTNTVYKMRKQLAVILTIANDKKRSEVTKKTK